MTDIDLDAALVDLAAHLDVPDIDVRTSVLGALRPEYGTKRAQNKWLGWRARVAAAVVALLVALGLVPGVRSAVADLFGLRGVKVEQREIEQPPAAPFLTGRRVSLEEAAAALGEPAQLPHEARVGVPDAIYIGEGGTDEHVQLVYSARDGLPSVDDTDIGLLLTEFRARHELPLVRKSIGAGARITSVDVRGSEAYWIEGPHRLTYTDEDGFHDESSRIAGNALLWQRGAITFRLESALPLSRALAIAETVR